MTILYDIVQVKTMEVAELKMDVPSTCWKSWSRISRDSRLPECRQRQACSIIAEVKENRRPREFVRDFDPVRIASVYEQNGAAAVSVLTDVQFFGGDKSYLGPSKKRRSASPAQGLHHRSLQFMKRG